MAFWQWSKTAANNANSDPTINWSEGQAPSSINDSARAGNARLAEWRDDISGTITTAGSLSAYTVASNQGFDTAAHMNGAMLAFVPHTTCGATVTLNVDGLGAKPLRTSPGVELQAGTIIQGTPYVATYNNTDGAFYLRGFYGNPYNIPLGGLLPYTGSTAPNSNFVLPFGQAISRTTYATYFALVGTTYGVGDGSTTFNVINLRGRAIFGLDNMGGTPQGLITVAGGNFDGTVIGGFGGAQNRILTTAQIPAHAHPVFINEFSGHSHAVAGTLGAGGGAGSTQPLVNGSQSNAPFGTAPATTGIRAWDGTTLDTTAQAGGGGSFPAMPPAITLPYILRVI